MKEPLVSSFFKVDVETLEEHAELTDVSEHARQRLYYLRIQKRLPTGAFKFTVFQSSRLKF